MLFIKQLRMYSRLIHTVFCSLTMASESLGEEWNLPNMERSHHAAEVAFKKNFTRKRLDTHLIT